MLKDISNNLSLRSNHRKNLTVKKSFSIPNVNGHTLLKESLHEERRTTWKENMGQSSETDLEPKTSILKEKPSYRFPKMFKNIDDKLFPFIALLHRQALPPSMTKERAVNLISEVRFARNPIRKYKQPLKENYHYAEINTQESSSDGKHKNNRTDLTKNEWKSPHKKLVDPTDRIFASTKNSNCILGFGKHLIEITALGSYEHKVEDSSFQEDQESTLGSKRSFSVMESSSMNISNTMSNLNFNKNMASFSTSNISISSNLESESPLATKRLKAVDIKAPRKGLSISHSKHNYLYNHERIDNSMTISAKAILKMVDDSLVSSDNSLGSQSYANISCTQTPTTKSRRKQPVSINEADLQKVLRTDDYSNANGQNADVVGRFSTPSAKKFRMLGPN